MHRGENCVMRRLLPLLALTAVVSAYDNPFSYSYVADTEKPGELEFEQFVTMRAGRDLGSGYAARYRGFDFETDFEYGLSPADQISLEVNHVYVDSSVREGFRFQGLNLGYKHMFADPSARDWGHALHVELGYSQASSADGSLRHRYGAEAKYIFQHDFGSRREWTYVGNLILDVVRASGAGENTVELELTQGLALALGPNWRVGLEGLAEAEWEGFEELEAAGLFLGPVLSYRNGDLNASLTLLAQVTGTPRERGGLNVSELSPYQVRLRFAFDF